jgi:hypothetical protein
MGRAVDVVGPRRQRPPIFLLFLATSVPRGRVDFVVVAAGRGRREASNVVRVVVEICRRLINLRLPDVVPPSLVANVAVGQEQRLLLIHVYVCHDARASESHLRAPVFVEEAEIVSLVGLHMSSRGLPIFQHHVGVVCPCHVHDDVGMDGGGLLHWLVHPQRWPVER